MSEPDPLTQRRIQAALNWIKTKAPKRVEDMASGLMKVEITWVKGKATRVRVDEGTQWDDVTPLPE
jgi:hypothetical protein